MFEKGPTPAQEKSKGKFPNVDVEVAKSLEQLDFNELKNIFSEMIQDTGLNPEKNIGKFISDSANFKEKNTHGSRAEKAALDPIIYINSKECRQSSAFYESYAKNSTEKELFRKQFYLRLVCHEEAHAVSFDEMSLKKLSLLSGGGTLKSGYSVSTEERKLLLFSKIERVHMAFNEAVTELLTRRVIEKYATKKAEDINHDILVDMDRKAYWEEIEMFDAMCSMICRECDIDNDVLWKIILRGYFGGEDLSGDRMKRLFKHIFPAEFEKELAEWKGGDQETKESLIEMIKHCDWTDNDRKCVRRWVMSVYHTMPNSQER